MKKRDSRLWFAAALTAMALVLGVRGLYGFCWSDESFYLTFAQRLWNGQKLILDEWHPVQFYSVLFYPILTVYRALFGTRGIYLFARELYVLAAWAASLYLYFTLCREARPLFAFLCAGLYLSYSRGNIWGPSYYNLFLTFGLLSACLAFRGRRGAGKGRGLRFFLCGLCLAAAVLCVPYFALFVILGLGAVLCLGKTRKDALWALGGICLGAAVFLLCFLPKDIGGVLAGLKQILSDPEHDGGPVSYLLAAIRDVKLLYFYEAALALLAGAVLAAGMCFLPKAWGALPGLAVAAFGAAASLWRYRAAETGFAFYQLALFCLPGLVLCWVRGQIRIPALLLRLLGVCMGLAMALSSNTEAITFTVGLPVYAIGAVLQLSAVQNEEGKSLRFFAGVLAAAVLCVSFSCRITQVFRDGPLNTLTQTMTDGPAAGLRTTEEHAGQYGQILAMLESLENTYSSENRIFFTSILPWGYLATDFPCGAPTAWRTKLSSPRLESYYETHPVPAIVVVLKENMGASPDKHDLNENEFSGPFWEELQESYSHIAYPCADVYISPNAILKGA